MARSDVSWAGQAVGLSTSVASTAIRRAAARGDGGSRHHGDPIKNSAGTYGTLGCYCTEGFKWGP